MSGCMATDKPLVSIVMAVYEPNMDWLREQLESLNVQTYPNIELLVRDDCSLTVPFEEICGCVEGCITAFPFQIQQNERNLGSNGTFERLTLEAKGAYIAYCDQDDVWEKNKVLLLEQHMKAGTSFVYSDMRVIDSSGNIVAESLKHDRPRLKYREGTGLARYYAFTNCTAGCSMLMRSDLARMAVPFPEGTVCDQWLCLTSSATGAVSFIESPLVKYRIHGSNQTGVLAGISTKEEYMNNRIRPMQARVLEFDRRYGAPQDVVAFAQARAAGHVWGIWKNRELCRKDAWFEIVMKFLPASILRQIIKKAKQGV